MVSQPAHNSQAHLIPNDKESVEGANNIFCYAALADKQAGTLYTDATGAFPKDKDNQPIK